MADPSWYRRVLADLPTPAQVWAEASEIASGEAALYYAANRFVGLYEQARGLLEALVAADDQIHVSNSIDPT
jgi:hypothetical protein